MYSVIRFTTEAARVQDLLAIGEEMNQVEEGVFTGPRRAGDGFSCDIETSDLWAHHLEGVLDFLDVHASSVRRATALGAKVTFDVAIDPEDQAAQKHALILPADAELLAKLGNLGVNIELTIYRPQLASDPA